MNEISESNMLAASQAQVELTMQISMALNQMIASYEGQFPETPALAYQVAIGTLARSIGQIASMFPTEESDKIVHYAVTEILDQQNRSFVAAHPDPHRSTEFGHA